MKKSDLYTIKKIEMTRFINFNKEEKTNSFNRDIVLTPKEQHKFSINQHFNHLFRIIKKIRGTNDRNIKDVLFIDCHKHKLYEHILDSILRYGVSVDGVQYKYWGKSASMSRNGILGLVSEEVYDTVEQYAMMDIVFEKTVLSKFEAYKCLLLSSCTCIEGELPYMIVVDDYDVTIPNVNIKYVDEVSTEYVDKETGEVKTFVEKVIKEGVKDIPICMNDGAGLSSKELAQKYQKYMKLDYTPSAFMIRLPYVKGLQVVVDFKNYYKEKGITHITDIWGVKHKVEDIDMILTKSQYKGYKYFQINKDYSDWERYLGLLKKYDFCMGIAKVNYSTKKEPKMTRGNYQTLQTLDISADDLIETSAYTRRWIERILSGDLLYVYKYLGISEDTIPSNDYMKAILLNPQMVHDKKIKKYLFSLLQKTIDEMKIGKIHIKGAFKFLIPDVIMMLEYIGGLEAKGCLKAGQMYSKDHIGEYLLNRNPHLSRSEHVILEAVNNEQTEKWLSHLEGVCMINGYDVTAPRLNGAD